jgi:probable HAF family extracellular repeat protein
MTDLGTLGGVFGNADWINNRGQIVGASDLAGDLTSHPFLWDPRNSQMVDLGTVGGDNGEAFSVNDEGVVVGRADVPGSQAHHAFRWKKGAMQDLGTPDDDTCNTALSINSAGQVVGDSGICGRKSGPRYGPTSSPNTSNSLAMTTIDL